MELYLPTKATQEAMTLMLLKVKNIPSIHIMYECDSEIAYMQLDHSFYAEFQGKKLLLYAHRIYSSLKTRNNYITCSLRDIIS